MECHNDEYDKTTMEQIHAADCKRKYQTSVGEPAMEIRSVKRARKEHGRMR